jgi:hypothetical protein
MEKSKIKICCKGTDFLNLADMTELQMTNCERRFIIIIEDRDCNPTKQLPRVAFLSILI